MRALRIVGDADEAGQGQYMSLKTGLEFQAVKGRASQCKAREGFKDKARQVVALQGKAIQVLEVEANARLELDKWVRKSGGGWVSKTIQGSGEKTLCVWRVVGLCAGVCEVRGGAWCCASGRHPTTTNVWERKVQDECVFTNRPHESACRQV